MARPFRYTFILTLVGAGTVLAAVGGWRFARASAPVNGPIVLISVDSLRADRLPIYGYRGTDTPAIDALAADGIVFERVYTHSPSTLPAHAALMSGRLPIRNGVRGSLGYKIDRDEVLLAEILRARDYATAAVVSSYTLRRETGLSQGFTFFDDELVEEPWSGRRSELRRPGADSRRIAEEWLETAGTQRVFLFLHLDDLQQPTEVASSANEQGYDRAVEYADQVVGDMIDYLKSHQLYDQSTVVLVSDHGEGLGDHGERSHGLLLYDETLRVPLVIKPAASEQGGRRVDDLVQLVDLMPTIVDLAKAPLPDGVDGHSLASLLNGTGDLSDRLAYAESMYGRQHFGWSGLRAISDGRHRYISAPREELYDLELDPDERRNIIDNEPDIAERLRTALQQLVANDVVMPPVQSDAGVRARLIALGAVGTRHPAAADPDPTLNPVDRVAFVEAYRHAIALFADGQWSSGVAALERLARSEPDDADLWEHLGDLATTANRHELAGEAYRRVYAIRPQATNARLGAAMAAFHLRRFDEAARRARAALTAAGQEDPAISARAHELLARVALFKRDTASAFAHALEGQNADPRLPLISYVEGRRHVEQGRYDDALTSFMSAIEMLEESQGDVTLADLHFQAAEVLAQTARAEETAAHYAAEIEAFPSSLAARAALARLYHAEGRAGEAALAVADLIRFSPTPDGYHLAARLWTAFGDVQQAAAVRAEAGRLSGAPAPTRSVHE